MFDPSTSRLANATERIADVVERMEQADNASDRLNELLLIWDEWFNANEAGASAQAAKDAMSKIGHVLYRSAR